MRRARFLRAQFSSIQAEAGKAAKPNGAEVCGLILDNGSFCELILVRNKSKAGGGFSFYFNEVRAVRKWASLCRHEIVGTFHSHPLGLAIPGPGDLRGALDGSIMLIFDVLGRSAQLWQVKDGELKQLRFRLI